MFHNAKMRSGGNSRDRIWSRSWKAAALVLSLGLAVSIFAAHIMPALTMERAVMLDCRLSIHQHTGSCFDGEGEIICGYADFVVHTHNGDCYDGSGRLICSLPEVETHVHRASCYSDPELLCGLVESDGAEEDGSFSETENAPEIVQGHVHTDACYELVLTCAAEEGGGHTHTDSCYGPGEESLTCGMEEHAHTDACYVEGELTCGTEEHTHSDACWTEGDPVLICGQEEAAGHLHGEECYEQVLICELPEAAAETETEVPSEEPVPAPQGHVHGEACYGEPRLTCGREEIVLHTHDAGCFDESGRLTCGMLEVQEHIHDESCFPQESDFHEDDTAADVPETGTDAGEEAGTVPEEDPAAEETPPAEEEFPWWEELPENLPPADDPWWDGKIPPEDGDPAGGDAAPEEDAEGNPPEEEILDEEEPPAPEETLPEEEPAPEEELPEEEPAPEGLPEEELVPEEEAPQEAPAIQQSDSSWASVEKPGYTPPQEGALSEAAQALTDAVDTVSGFVRHTADLERSHDLEADITDVQVLREHDGRWVSADTVMDGERVQVTVSYSIGEGIIGRDVRRMHYLLPDGLQMDGSQEGFIWTGDGCQVGTYEIDAGGLIALAFDEPFADGKAFTGQLWFACTVSAEDVNADGEIIFGGNGGFLTLVTAPEEETNGLAVHQTGAYSKDSGNLAYTLTISSTEEQDGTLTVQSTFEEGKAAVLPDSFTIWEERDGALRELSLDEAARLTADADGAGWTAELNAPRGPVSYTITWEAVPVKDADGGFRTANRASAQLAGAAAEDVCVIACAPEQLEYTLTVYSPDAETGVPVAGALYGLYDFRGELLDTASSDDAGEAVFREVVPDTLLYIQQIQAPNAYQLSGARVWFHYDDTDSAELEAQLAAAAESAVFREGDRQPEAVTNRGETDVLREGYAATAEAIEVPQQPAQAGYELPATGGPGTARYMAGGIALLLAAGLTYLLPRLREKRHP